MCQLSGACSFPDPQCPSGQRYGEHSSPSLAGSCVDPSGEEVGGTESGVSTSVPGGAEATVDGGQDADGAGAGGVDGQGGTSTHGPGTSSSGAGETVGDEGPTGGTSEGSSSLEEGLILWLEFDETFDDSSPVPLEVSCDAQTCPGFVQRDGADMAASFDGDDDHVRVGHDESLQTQDAFTVCAWANLDPAATQLHHVVGKPFQSEYLNSYELFFDRRNGDHDVVFQTSSTGPFLSVRVTNPVEPGAWIHVVGRYDGTEFALYLDGTRVDGIAPDTIFYDDGPVVIGADYDNGDARANEWIGQLDDVRVYERALTPEEISTLAQLRE